MTTFGYSRVSSRKGQSHDRQLAALREQGISNQHIFMDSATGANIERTGLKTLLSHLRQDDTLVVTELARLGRSLRDLVNICHQLEDTGVAFRSIKENIDTSTPTGRMTFGILASIAEFEREIIRERQAAGIKLAKERGSYYGRQPKLSQKQADQLKKLRAENRFTIKQLAKMFDVGEATVYRYLKV